MTPTGHNFKDCLSTGDCSFPQGMKRSLGLVNRVIIGKMFVVLTSY